MIFGPKIDFFELVPLILVTRDFAARSPELSGLWKDSSGLYDRDTTDLMEHSSWQNLIFMFFYWRFGLLVGTWAI